MVDIPVSRRRGYSGDSLVRRDHFRRDNRNDYNQFDEFDRHFDNMERQLTNFQPFDMFPFSDRGPGSWFRQMNEQMRRAHNQMMEFMRDSGMNRSFDDFWHFPSMADCFTKDENGQILFRTKFNLQDFDPEDIEVRVENQTLSVHAKHVRRTSNSSSGQYFCRAMLLPDGIRTEELKSRLDKDGFLVVEAPVIENESTQTSPQPSTISSIKVIKEEMKAPQSSHKRNVKFVDNTNSETSSVLIARPFDKNIAPRPACKSDSVSSISSATDEVKPLSADSTSPSGLISSSETEQMNGNGILTVEAPAPSVNLEQLGPSRLQRIPIEDGGRRHRIDAIKDNVREKQDGSRELNISLPVEDIYDQKDISIRCDGRKLYVEGDKGDDHFTRTFYIPEDTDPSKINAKLNNGVLTITGPIP